MEVAPCMSNEGETCKNEEFHLTGRMFDLIEGQKLKVGGTLVVITTISL